MRQRERSPLAADERDSGQCDGGKKAMRTERMLRDVSKRDREEGQRDKGERRDERRRP